MINIYTYIHTYIHIYIRTYLSKYRDMSKSKLHYENKWISLNRWNTKINANYIHTLEDQYDFNGDYSITSH